MDLTGYLRYVAAFNSQDWDLVHREFYAEDFRAEFPIAKLASGAESLAWFHKAHEALFETLVPVEIEIAEDGRSIAAALQVQFIALGDTAFMPGLNPARAGDAANVPMTVMYEIDEHDRITRIDVAITGRPTIFRLTSAGALA